MSTILSLAWPVLLLPLAAVLLARWASARLSQRNWAAAAIAGGFLLAYAALYHDQWHFPPAQALDWLGISMAAGWVIFTLADIYQLKRLPRLALRLLASSVTTCLLLLPVFSQWTGPQALATVAAITLVWTGLWSLLDREKAAPALTGMLLFALAACYAVIVAILGSLLIGQLSGALAAGITFWRILPGRSNIRQLPGAGVAVSVMGLGGLVLLAHYFAEVPWLVALLPLMGILSGNAATHFRRNKNSQAGLVKCAQAGLAALLPGLLAIGLVLQTFLTQPGGY